ncbi:MAG: rhomboid family intramembrane serine protease [Ignavibacteria bacterium]|nr:rhomboid family intramembrane serine protease [Ignavibacteria bacterium]
MFGGFSFFPPVIKFMLISNVVIFFLQRFFLPMLKIGVTQLDYYFLNLFALQPIFGIAPEFIRYVGDFYPWQIITYMFLHGDFGHLFFNMFALWMFGVEIENLWGSKKFLIYYFLCGISAAVANLFIAPLFSTVGPTIGASGAVYGVLVAFAFLFPNRHIYLYFLLPIKAKYLIIFYMALEVIYVASNQATGIAHIAHLGGAVAGLIYLFSSRKSGLKSVFDKFKETDYTRYADKTYGSKPFEPPKREEPKTEKKYYDAQYYEIQKEDLKREQEEEQMLLQKRIDSILDKVAQSGYASLTEEEKRILFEDSKKLR